MRPIAISLAFLASGGYGRRLQTTMERMRSSWQIAGHGPINSFATRPGGLAEGGVKMIQGVEVEPRPGYSKADQVARFAAAKEVGDARYLDIDTVFDGSYLK